MKACSAQGSPLCRDPGGQLNEHTVLPADMGFRADTRVVALHRGQNARIRVRFDFALFDPIEIEARPYRVVPTRRSGRARTALHPRYRRVSEKEHGDLVAYGKPAQHADELACLRPVVLIRRMQIRQGIEHDQDGLSDATWRSTSPNKREGCNASEARFRSTSSASSPAREQTVKSRIAARLTRS